MAEPDVEHRLIIRREQPPAVFLQAHDGQWALPSFIAPDCHTADVAFINAAVRQRYGLETTVLRCLDHQPGVAGSLVRRLFELESHSDAPPPAGWQWRQGHELNALRWQLPEDAAAVLRWSAAGNRRAANGQDWALSGWWDNARAWIMAQLHALGIDGTIDTEQVRVWDCSCVFRLHTPAGTFYFKALSAALTHELAVTTYLARDVGGCVPDVVAVEPQRRWMLMRGAPGENLEATTDVATWQHAVQAYAQLQTACIPRTAELRALGCIDRSLAALRQRLGALVADRAALLPGDPTGLSDVEIATLHAAIPRLQQQCETLQACGLPPTIDHGDLWPANILVQGDRCTVIDWEDVAIGPPFFSLAPLLVGARIFHPSIDIVELATALRAPYLSAFATVAPTTTIARAFDLARPLGICDMAVRYWQQPVEVVQMHPWMRELVPYLLRVALEELAR